LQPLDGEGKAVQLMRSWLTGMPGERVSCVGCHEGPSEASPPVPTAASQRRARDFEPWFGPERGFDFAREVQPVLNRRCAGCHDGEKAAPDLRAEELVGGAQEWPRSATRTASVPGDGGGDRRRMTYTPAYDELVHHIRRPGIEDDVSLLVPGEYHADTSPLIQMLRKGHHGVELDDEEWDRLVTWIDMNAPCHGTWGEIFPVPNGAHERRLECWEKYGGPATDPEVIPKVVSQPAPFVKPAKRAVAKDPILAGWPWSADEAKRRQQVAGRVRQSIDLGGGIRMNLARIPAGKFIMGCREGADDERGRSVKEVGPFWIGTCEVSNEQFRRFDPAHDPGYYARRLSRPDGRGLPLSGPKQPAVRVSWLQAVDYCRWLSEKTGMEFSLPTEEEWEYACRAGSGGAMWYGPVDVDFSQVANLADLTFSRGVMKPQKVHPASTTQWSGGVPHLVLEGAKLADSRFADGFSVTSPVGSFRPNIWGLHDVHGNAAEWTASAAGASGRRVVRGGSFFDPPRRARCGSRVDFPEWQRVFNVGFRVVCRVGGS
jgi:formylglycine-generating enzyme required for sulfatase activity